MRTISSELSGVYRLAVRAGLKCWFSSLASCATFGLSGFLAHIVVVFSGSSAEDEDFLGQARGECL